MHENLGEINFLRELLSLLIEYLQQNVKKYTFFLFLEKIRFCVFNMGDQFTTVLYVKLGTL